MKETLMQVLKQGLFVQGLFCFGPELKLQLNTHPLPGLFRLDIKKKNSTESKQGAQGSG